MLNKLVDAIVRAASTKERVLVFVCGMGSSGKTHLSEKLKETLPLDCVVVHSDWYLRHPTEVRKQRIKTAQDSGDTQRIKQEEYSFNWYDWGLHEQDLYTLYTTGKLHVHKAWDQATGLKDLEFKLEVSSPGVIICEGIYLLHDPIFKMADVTVLLHASEKASKHRAISRDGHRNDIEYLKWKHSLRQKYVQPYFDLNSNRADIVIDNTDFDAPVVTKGLA